MKLSHAANRVKRESGTEDTNGVGSGDLLGGLDSSCKCDKLCG